MQRVEAPSHGFESVVLLADDPEVARIVRDELRVEPQCCRTATDCPLEREGLDRRLYVVDWGVGRSEALGFLRTADNNGLLDLAQVILLDVSSSEEAICCACEYRCSHFLGGSYQSDSLREAAATVWRLATTRRKLQEITLQARQAVREGTLAQAAALLETEVAAGRDQADLLRCELAQIYLTEQKYSQVVQLLAPREQSTGSLQVLNLLSRAYMAQRQFPQAERLLERARTLNPYQVERILALGDVLLERQKFTQAGDAYSQALRLDPENRKAQAGIARSQVMSGDLNQALEFIATLGDVAAMASVFNSAAVFAARAEKYDESMRLYEAALQALRGADPQLQARVWFNKGLCCDRRGETAEAWRCVQESVRLDPNFDKASHMLARLQKNDLAHAFDPRPAASGQRPEDDPWGDALSLPLEIPGRDSEDDIYSLI